MAAAVALPGKPAIDSGLTGHGILSRQSKPLYLGREEGGRRRPTSLSGLAVLLVLVVDMPNGLLEEL
jgi:hypothetical protein